MILRLALAFALVVAAPALAQDTRPEPPEREPYRDPDWAAVRSALVPGWIQLEYGFDQKGSLMLGTSFLTLATATGLVEVPFLDDPDFSRALGIGLHASLAVLSAVDAYGIVDRLNVENGYDIDSLADRGDDPWVSVALVRRAF